MTYMNSNELAFSNHTGAYMVRPLGALEEFIWLLDQSRPAQLGNEIARTDALKSITEIVRTVLARR
jgi:hypothetical protein